MDENRPRPIDYIGPDVDYADRFAHVRRHRVRFAGGAEDTHWVITSGSGVPDVVILPWRDGHVGLAESYRYTVDEWLWEIPRGRDQSPASRTEAARELHEETRADQVELIDLNPIPLYTDSRLLDTGVAFFLAKLAPGCPYRVGEEIADVRWVRLAEAKRMILVGQIRDQFTVAALALAEWQELLH